jgi:hypothetical protein
MPPSSNIQPNVESHRPLRHTLRQGDQIFFLHIPKTAGSSLIDILQMQVNPGEFYSFPDGPDQVQQPPIEVMQAARIVRGHRMYDFQKYFARRPFVITLLRNPYDRVISNYAHIARNNAPRLVKLARVKAPERGEEPVTLEEYISSPPMQNRLIQFLIGHNGALKPPYKEHVALAKVHLESLAFFGLKERFDDSVKLLAYTFGWSPIKMEAKLNLAPSDSKPKVTPEIQELLEKTNKLDMELYQYACELFDHRFQQMERELKEHAR